MENLEVVQRQKRRRRRPPQKQKKQARHALRRRVRAVGSGGTRQPFTWTVHVPRQGSFAEHLQALAFRNQDADAIPKRIWAQFLRPAKGSSERLLLVPLGPWARSLYEVTERMARYGFQPATPWHLLGLVPHLALLHRLRKESDMVLVAPTIAHGIASKAPWRTRAPQVVFVVWSSKEGMRKTPLLKEFGHGIPNAVVAFIA